MWTSAVLTLIVAARAMAMRPVPLLSAPPFPPPSHLPPPTQSGGTPLIPSSSPTSSFYSGNNNSPPLPSSATLTTTSISVLTEPGPSVIPVTPYAFEPFPSPSFVPPIPGVYPASSPKHPPPVESSALVPDFAPAWIRAYTKAKAKVGISNLFKYPPDLFTRVRAVVCATCDS